MSSTGHGHKCCHESLGDLTPVDVYFGRGQIISLKREMIKKQTIEKTPPVTRAGGWLNSAGMIKSLR
jgi:hypothetical protein